jgi:hypothetical protein
MRTKILLTIVCLTIVVIAQAQKKGFRYNSIVQAGLLEGEQGSALQLQTIQGVKFKTWSAGIGAGLDYYHTRTIPLFLDVRKAFRNKEKAAFVYASGGYNFPWVKKYDATLLPLPETNGGLYYTAGIGYQLPILKTSALFFTAGYSVKKLSTTIIDDVVIAIYPPQPLRTYLYQYSLERISIKTGLRF